MSITNERQDLDIDKLIIGSRPADTTNDRPGEAGLELDENQLTVAKALAAVPTKSTAHMELQERTDGINQMLEDLAMLAAKDGCIAAAWALEKLIAVSRQADELVALKARLAEVEQEKTNALISRDFFEAMRLDAWNRAEAAEAERDKFKRIDECNQGTIDIAIRRAEAAEMRVKKLERKIAWAENAEEMNGVVIYQVELIRQHFDEEFKPLGNSMWRLANIGEACRVMVAAEKVCLDKDNAADYERETLATTPPASGAQSS